MKKIILFLILFSFVLGNSFSWAQVYIPNGSGNNGVTPGGNDGFSSLDDDPPVSTDPPGGTPPGNNPPSLPLNVSPETLKRVIEYMGRSQMSIYDAGIELFGDPSWGGVFPIVPDDDGGPDVEPPNFNRESIRDFTPNVTPPGNNGSAL